MFSAPSRRTQHASPRAVLTECPPTSDRTDRKPEFAPTTLGRERPYRFTVGHAAKIIIGSVVSNLPE